MNVTCTGDIGFNYCLAAVLPKEDSLREYFAKDTGHSNPERKVDLQRTACDQPPQCRKAGLSAYGQRGKHATKSWGLPRSCGEQHKFGNCWIERSPSKWQ